MSAVWTELTKKSRSVFKKPVDKAFEAQVQVQSILADNKFNDFLPLGDAKKLADGVDEFLMAYACAAAAADNQSSCLFSVVPKHHWYWHWADRARLLNPRKGNCMVDEGFVGIMKDVAATCTANSPTHKVPENLMTKYRWGVHFGS